MTPERRAEIESEAKSYLNYSAHPEIHDLIRELLAEIDRLNARDQEYTQYQRSALRSIGAEYILLEAERLQRSHDRPADEQDDDR